MGKYTAMTVVAIAIVAVAIVAGVIVAMMLHHNEIAASLAGLGTTMGTALILAFRGKEKSRER